MSGRHRQSRDRNAKTQRVTRLSHAKVKRITHRRIGNQAAYEQQLSHELCDDLARTFARQSGGARANYGLIVRELLRVRPTAEKQSPHSLVRLLLNRYDDDKKLREFLKALSKRIYDYTLARIDGQDY